MSQRNNTISLTLISIVAIAAVGCSTLPDLPPPVMAPPPASVTYTQQLDYPAGKPIALQKRLIDSEDPADYVAFALYLSTIGRHRSAQLVFLDAAQKFKSHGRELEITCLAASANEAMLAGDMSYMRNTLRRLRQVATPYQLAGAGADLSVLFALGAIANGETRPTEASPAVLRELYRMNQSTQ